MVSHKVNRDQNFREHKLHLNTRKTHLQINKLFQDELNLSENLNLCSEKNRNILEKTELRIEISNQTKIHKKQT